MAMPSSPRSPLLSTSASADQIGVGRLTPLRTSYTRPRFSVTKKRPSGRKAIPVGVTNPALGTASSIAKFAGKVTAAEGRAKARLESRARNPMTSARPRIGEHPRQDDKALGECSRRARVGREQAASAKGGRWGGRKHPNMEDE